MVHIVNFRLNLVTEAKTALGDMVVPYPWLQIHFQQPLHPASRRAVVSSKIELFQYNFNVIALFV